MATPHVAGAAALSLSMHPGEPTQELKADLMRAVDPVPALKGRVATGGRLNLYKALAASTVAVQDGVLRVQAGDGEANHFTLRRVVAGAVTTYHVTDPWTVYKSKLPMGGSRLAPGAGCIAVSDTEVACAAAGVTAATVTAGDLDDSVVATTMPVPVTLDGGPGIDALTGGLAADTFLGGTGNDTISARDKKADAAFDCGEEAPAANDADRVLADRIDPVLASKTGCESVSKA
jgi:Ca2+-binding RTX toxin-like protein